MPTLLRLAADLVVIVHGGFVVFVILGGLLAVRWPRIVWVHLPAVVWGAAIELIGWICPLTPLENYFRERSGSTAYSGDFIEHHLLPLIYPADLTRERQIYLGAAALILNVLVYAYVLRARSRRRPRATSRDRGDRRSRN